MRALPISSAERMWAPWAASMAAAVDLPEPRPPVRPMRWGGLDMFVSPRTALEGGLKAPSNPNGNGNGNDNDNDNDNGNGNGNDNDNDNDNCRFLRYDAE